MSNNIKITINEQNQTVSRPIPETSDIVYVPGLTPNNDESNVNNPILYTTLEEFKEDFSNEPNKGGYKYTSGDTVSPYISGNDTGFITVGKHDTSYTYAYNLLAAGLQVYYECAQSVPTTRNLSLTFTPACDDILTTDGNTFRVTLDETGMYPKVCSVILNLNSNYNIFSTSGLQLVLNSKDVDISASIHTSTINNITIDEDNKLSWSQTEVLKDADIVILDLMITPTREFFSNLDVPNESKTAEFSITVVDGNQSSDTTVSAIDSFYSGLLGAFDRLRDKNEYSVKYITTGGYPSYDVIVDDVKLSQRMMEVAAARGDAVALIDHKYNTTTSIDPAVSTSVYATVCADNFNDLDSYGAMFTPWGTYGDTLLPASYAYLSCLARSIKTSPNFVAIAGVARGLVTGLTELNTGTQVLTSTIAENYQPKQKDDNIVGSTRSINAITKIRPYGLCIWGNRTLAPITGGDPTAVNFLNTRLMLCDIKKVAYTTAKNLMFEQDSDKLWLRFKSGVSGLLDQLKTGYGIKDYKILRVENAGRGHMRAKILVYPLYAIEYFEISVVVTDGETDVV